MLEVAKRFDDRAAEVIDAAIDVEEQGIAHLRIVTDGGQRSDERWTDEFAILLAEGLEEPRHQGAIRMALEIAVAHLAQPIVRRAQDLGHLVCRSRIVEAGEQHQAAEPDEPVLVFANRLEQGRDRLGGRRAAHQAASLGSNAVVEIAKAIDGGAQIPS